MSEVKEYVSVSEKDFGRKKTLELTFEGKMLDSDLQRIISEKIADLNAKIDEKYDVGFTDFKGIENISSNEIKKLSAQLKEIIRGFNEEIARIEQEYIGEIRENIGQIRTEITKYFSDKSLFVEELPSGFRILVGYASMNRDAARPSKAKELHLG